MPQTELSLLRRNLIQRLGLAIQSDEESVLEDYKTNYKILVDLSERRFELTQDVKNAAITYFQKLIEEAKKEEQQALGTESDQDPNPLRRVWQIDDDCYTSFFQMAIATGLVPIAEAMYESQETPEFWLADVDEVGANAITKAVIKSGSEDMANFISSTQFSGLGAKNFFDPGMIAILVENFSPEEQIEFKDIIPNFLKLVAEKEKEKINEAIQNGNTLVIKNKLETIPNLDYYQLIQTAIDNHSKKEVLVTILKCLEDTIDYEALPHKIGTELYLSNLLYPQQIQAFHNYFATHHDNYSQDEIKDIILHYNCSADLLNKLIINCRENMNSKQLISLMQQGKLSPQNFNKIFNFSLSNLSSQDLESIFSKKDLDEEHVTPLLSIGRERLIDDDFILFFYLNAPNRVKIQEFLVKNQAYILEHSKSESVLALLLASGVTLEIFKKQTTINQVDFLHILLIAASYPDSKFKHSDLVAALDHIDNKEMNFNHLALAEKLENQGCKERIRQALALQGDEALKEEKAVVLQGGIRLFNRATTLYPTLFSSPTKSYLHWTQEKARSRVDPLNSTLKRMMYSMLYLHERTLVNDKVAYLPFVNTYQYINKEENLKSILLHGHLLSQQARKQMGISPAMPSILTNQDKAISDDQLVCTAPQELADVWTSDYKLQINLSKLPIPYLHSCVLKTYDYATLPSKFFNKIPITPDVNLKIIRNPPHKDSIYRFTLTGKSFDLPVKGENEIFHGIDGFKEATSHLFLTVGALPDDDVTALAIKGNISNHFQSLNQTEFLAENDRILKAIFKYMEIDFPRGLPFSINYIEAIQYLPNKVLNFQAVITAIQKNNLNQLNDYLEQFSTVFNTPILIQELLRITPPYNYEKVSALLEKKFPEAYVGYKTNIMSLYKNTPQEIEKRVMQLANQDSKASKYDLNKVLNRIKEVIKQQPELLNRLAASYQDEIAVLQEEFKKLYTDIQFAGGNSKLIELFATPSLIYHLTTEGGAVIAAILARELEAQLNNTESNTTLVTKIKSQQSLEERVYSLGSILSHGLNYPAFFLEACPINRPMSIASTLSPSDIFRNYAMQKTYFAYNLDQLEKALLNFCKQYHVDLDDCLMDYQGSFVAYTTNYWSDYEDNKIEFILNAISENAFCNNAKVPQEVQLGLDLLIHKLYPNQGNNPNVTKEQLVSDLIDSTLILYPDIAHLLFDTLHFGVGLTSIPPLKITLANHEEISFRDLISACAQKLTEGVYPSQTIMAEQLALRFEQLEYWLETNVESYLSYEESRSLGV